MGTPHDALFKAIFSAPQDAAGLLRPLLPEAVATALDWSSLQPAHGSFVDDALRHLHADLLFDVQLAGQRAHLYLLVEHKAHGDRFTALHLLRYVARIWARFHEQYPRARFLPHVVPLVLHHGRLPWRAPTSIHELLDPSGLTADAARALARSEPDFGFPVDDLATTDDDGIRRRPISDLAQLALACMRSLRHVDADAALAMLARWLDSVARALAAPLGTERIQVVWSYLFQVTDLPLARLAPLLAEAGPNAQATLMSTANKLRAEGRTQGRTEGLAEGHAAGRAELLLQLLAKRYGPLPVQVIARVRAATVADLDRWAEAVLTEPTLDGVFGT